MPPKFLAYLVILCFERRYPKQNIVARLKSHILAPQMFWIPTILGWLRHWLHWYLLESDGTKWRQAKQKTGSRVCVSSNSTMTIVTSKLKTSCSRVITINTTLRVKVNVGCFDKSRWNNSFSRFSFFTALFSWPTIRTCSKITAVQLQMHWW